MKKLLLIAIASSVLFTDFASAQTLSNRQSSARPFGLQPYALVYRRATDGRSTDFQNNYLPQFQELINQHLSESAVFANTEGFKLDASRLFLRTTSDQPIRVYFVHEGAGYKNTLGFSMTPAGAEETGQPYLIFPNASFNGPTSTSRTNSAPLLVGDFVQLNSGAPGIQLDFFLIADGAGANNVGTWYNDPERNVDGLRHVVAFLVPGSRYVLIGFEDLYGGGDLDYNDCLFAVDIGEVNAENLFDIEGTLPN
jgi:Domain of unknown function (DUF4114)